MFQILGMLDKLGAGIFYGIVSGIYSTVAKIYDIMLELVQSPSDMFTINLGNILDTAYVAAGVFMLFRVIIAMIQMFLNPDTVTDSSAGAGKLVTRVVTVIVLLIALKPTGFILGDSGLLRQIENALLADDGLITNIINGTNPSFDENNETLNKDDYVYRLDNSSSNFNTMNFSKYLYEDVSADNKKLTCYYLKVYSHSQKVEGNNVNHQMTINKVYKIEFYNNNKDGKDGSLNCSNNVCKYSYTVRDGTRIAGKTENGNYSSLDGKISMGDAFSGSFPRKCPKYLQEKSSGNTYYAAMKKHPVDNNVSVCKGGVVGTSTETECKNTGIMGGYSTFDELRNVVTSLQLKSSGVSYSVSSTNPWIKKLTNTSRNEEEVGEKTYLQGVDEDAVKFAQTTAGTFMDCSGDSECNKAKTEMFKSSSANADIIDFVADDTMTLDWFTAAIVGVALIIYLLILCIDVIVRRLKLILMEMISPIPIVGYIDPKDKMFTTWFKMYISIYVDLFIKLIAMAFLVNLLKWDNLSALWGEDSGLLVKFFYIVAILVFVKVVPSMLTKIFGLDSNGGSFKDIIGMAKGAAGFGAGAALGGAVGAGAMVATMGSAWSNTDGSKLQKLKNAALAGGMGAGSALGSTVKGAGAGSKGKVFEGAKGAVTTAGSRMGKFREGFTPGNLVTAATVGRVGMSHAQRTDRMLTGIQQENERLSDVNKVKSEISSIASGSDFGTYVDNLANNNLIDTAQAKEWKDQWVDAQIDADRGNTAGVESFKDNVIGKNDLLKNYSGDIIEKGKQAQIRQQMRSLNDMIQGDSTISNVTGKKEIIYYAKSIEDENGVKINTTVKDADTRVNARKEENFNEISRQTQTSKYRTSKAALDSDGKK